MWPPPLALQEKRVVRVRPGGGPVKPVRPNRRLHWCTNLSNVTPLCFGYNSHQLPFKQKSSILPRRCWLSPLILSFRLKFSLFRVAFICIRAEVVSHPRHAVNPIPLDAMGRYTVGLTSSFSFSRKFSEGKGKSFCYLFQMICCNSAVSVVYFK
jgi:hypothetical protein